MKNKKINKNKWITIHTLLLEIRSDWSNSIKIKSYWKTAVFIFATSIHKPDNSLIWQDELDLWEFCYKEMDEIDIGMLLMDGRFVKPILKEIEKYLDKLENE